jgi:hypothetical protein
MKRMAAAPGVLFVLALALCPSPARASESFTLEIPLRGNAQQETGEVRVTLTLGAAPAGAQLVVNGANTLNLGDTQMVAGDSVTFATAGGNDVRITYRPLSNFPPSNFCQGGNALPKSVPMRFSGPQDVTSYRVATYIVASPTVECSQPSKHTGDTPATLSPVADGVAPALVADDLGRNTFDVILVLDKSGSMAELPPGAAAGATKAEILRSAFKTFVATWREMDQPSGTAEWSHDRIGVEFFNQGPLPQNFPAGDPPANFFVQRGSVLPGPWDAVIANIDTLTPGGSTSIGGGINDAMAKWKADPQSDLSLIVVTDGKQNTAPLIAAAPSGFQGLDPVAGLPQELRKRFIPIQTIGFGTPAGVDLDLLTKVSFETSGVSFISVNATTMFDAFSWMLIALLKGNTASLAMRHHDTMTGKGPAPLQPLLVDGSAQRVVFSVQWAPPEQRALDLEVFRPGMDPNGPPAVPKSGEKLPQATLQTFDLGQGDAGTWNVRVKRNGASHLEDVPYTLTGFFLERHLDYRIEFDKTAATGDNIGLRATVAWDGKPLAGLPPNAIRVRIQRPNEAIGTILHDSTANGGSGTTTTPSGDVQTPFDRKLAAITDASLLDRVLPRDVDTITLQDQGRGVYAGSFAGTSVPGSYGFEAVLDWDDPRTGHLRREERLEQIVKVKPDAAKTLIQTTRGGDGTVVIRVTPRDAFGNYTGPGYGSVVKAILASSGTLAAGEPVDRDQTGTYTFTVTGVPAGESPAVDLVVDGVAVGSAPPLPPLTPTTLGWRFFVDGGANFPHGSFSNAIDGRWSLNAGFERELSANWSIEGTAGHHRFDSLFVSNPHIWQLSLGGRRYFGVSPLRPFINASLGAYRFDPGNTTKGGGEVGAGILYELSPKLSIEGLWNDHAIKGNPSNVTFSTLQLGLRFAF